MLPWLGRTYAQTTRTEVSFTAHLHHLRQVHGVGGFVEHTAEVTGLPLDPSASWETAFEACFYRDVRKAGLRGPGQYPPKRTFDLALFSADRVVIVEAKAQQGFDATQLESFERDPGLVTALTGVDQVHLVALASSLCPFSVEERRVFPAPPLTWLGIAALYDQDPVLLRADAIYESAPSTQSYQAHNEGYRTGAQLVLAHQRGERLWVGRDKGLHGRPLAEDVLTGRWRTKRYETNATSEEPPSVNWFSLDAFVAHVDPG